MICSALPFLGLNCYVSYYINKINAECQTDETITSFGTLNVITFKKKKSLTKRE